MKGFTIASIASLSELEARHYLRAAQGDELAAAVALAEDRNILDGSVEEPDDTEVHHALYLLRRTLGQDAPSFDAMRVELRRRKPVAEASSPRGASSPGAARAA